MNDFSFGLNNGPASEQGNLRIALTVVEIGIMGNRARAQIGEMIMVSCRYDANEKRVIWDIQVKSLGELLEALDEIRKSMLTLGPRKDT